MSKPIVTIIMKDLGEIQIELYPTVAPETVNNFIHLINQDFYNGVIFHRVIPGFMAQGGDPTGTGMGGPGYGIKGEFTSNGFENKLSHVRGVISMARSNLPNSAGSQFFIVTDDSQFLDGQYAAFGSVISGMNIVDEIVNLPVTRRGEDRPINPPIIEKMTVDTLGEEYSEPNKLEK